MIRFSLIIIFFLISLLAVCKAPAYYLWLLAIGVTEFPLLFAGISAVLTLTGFWPQKYQLAGTVLGVLSVMLFLTPIIRAYGVAGTLKNDFNAAFGAGSTVINGDNTQPPFSLKGLFAGNKPVAYKSITYVKYADTALTIDYYPSQIMGKKPCVITVHGGSWSSGDSQQLPELNSYLARAGYNVAAINYRMAPKWQNPAPVQDIEALLKYLRQHADELKIDTNNFVLLGRSAGAQIALLAGYTLHDKGIKGVVDFYGPADMVWGYSIPSNPLIMDSRLVMERYLGGSYDNVPKNYVASSPMEFVSSYVPPTLIIHGDNDVLVSPEHSRRLDLKLEQHEVKHFWLKLPWATHGFDYNINGPGGQLATYVVERFLKVTTTAQAPQPPKGGAIAPGK